MRPFLFLLLTTFLCTGASAQRIMLLEKVNKASSERIYEGETLRFRLEGDKFWQNGFIREMRPDIQALVINDRFIMLDEINAIHRGSTFGKAAGLSLMTFGTVWTVIGAIGYNTDGDSSTQLSGPEIATGAAAFGLGYAINKLFGQKKFKPGVSKRLRIIDVSF